MGHAMTLLDVAKWLPDADRMLDIYAAKPWTPESSALFMWFPQDLDPIEEVCGMAWFCTVSEIEGFLDSWIEREKPSLRQQCEVLIQHVIYEQTVWDYVDKKP